MSLLFRYQTKELVLYQSMVVFGFGLLLIGQQVINTLQRLPSIQPQELGMLIVLMLPNIIGDVLPIALALSVLLLNGQMYAQYEMYVLHSAGVSRMRTQLPAVVITVIVGAILTLNLNELKPRAEVGLNELMHEVATSHFTIYVTERSFYQLPETNYTLWTERNEGGVLYDVFIQDSTTDTVYVAETASLESRDGFNYFTLRNGEILTQNAANGEVEHSSYDVLHQRVFQDPFSGGTGRREMTSAQLRDDPSNRNTSELMWRETQLLYVLTIFLLVSSLSPKSPRTTPAAGIFIGVVAFFVFNTLANNVRSAARDGDLPVEYAQVSFYLLVSALIVLVQFLLAAVNHAKYRRKIPT